MPAIFKRNCIAPLASFKKKLDCSDSVVKKNTIAPLASLKKWTAPTMLKIK